MREEMDGYFRQREPFSRGLEATAVLPGQKLLIRHLVWLSQQADLVEIQQGDAVFAQDGNEADVVAAIMLACQHKEATHYLLGFTPPTAVYPLVQLSIIDRVGEKTVWLKISSAEINGLLSGYV